MFKRKPEQQKGAELRSSLVDLCERGLLTCTKGEPGQPESTYALAWLLLDQSESYSEAVRERHAENMKRLTNKSRPDQVLHGSEPRQL